MSSVDQPQMPDSRPMLKQLQSSLKETDRTDVGVDESIGFRTFIIGVGALGSSPQGSDATGCRKTAVLSFTIEQILFYLCIMGGWMRSTAFLVVAETRMYGCRWPLKGAERDELR